MELQHSVRSPLEAVLEAVYKAIYGLPTLFTSSCLFFRLAMGYLICTFLCWILSSIYALASGSAYTETPQTEDVVIQVEVPSSEQVCFLVLFVFTFTILIYYQDIPQLPCEEIPPQKDELEDLGNPEPVCALLF